MAESSNGFVELEHMKYPHVWELSQGPDPEGVKDYLAWVLDDPDRAESAASKLRWLSIGMHFLTVAMVNDSDGQTLDKIELNFWNEAYPPGTGLGGHAHSRDMDLWLYADPRARQEITRIALLPPGTQRLPRPRVEERMLTILNKVEQGDGLGPSYNPRVIGERLVLESVTVVPALAHQKFSSLDIHEVRYAGPGTGVTVQRQGMYEVDALNTFKGLTTYKGLLPDEADMVRAHRAQLEKSTTGGPRKLVASTVLVRDMDFTLDQIDDQAVAVPPDRFEELAIGAIHSVERLIRSQAVT